MRAASRGKSCHGNLFDKIMPLPFQSEKNYKNLKKVIVSTSNCGINETSLIFYPSVINPQKRRLTLSFYHRMQETEDCVPGKK